MRKMEVSPLYMISAILYILPAYIYIHNSLFLIFIKYGCAVSLLEHNISKCYSTILQHFAGSNNQSIQMVR
jgi:hypothetical protein